MRLHAQPMYGSRANGPGLRSVIWLRGCSLGCPGCINPTTHAFRGGIEYNPEDLAAQIIRQSPKETTGVTVSGGEPMDQADELYPFFCMFRAERPHWTLGMFTGYDRLELLEGKFGEIKIVSYAQVLRRQRLWGAISDVLDWAIMGRYDYTKPVPEDWHAPDAHIVSSRNQYVALLSTRQTLKDFPARQIEIDASPEGYYTITGVPPRR